MKCQWITYDENKHITEKLSAKQEVSNLSKVFKFKQLIFWLPAEMLQCSTEAEQAPVDNHLLCGRKQGEIEQMALVLFCRGCFLWIRNALLNAKLCGRGEANWSPPAPRSSSGKGLLLCACCNSRVTASSAHSLMCRARGWTSHARGNFITSLTHPLRLRSPSKPLPPTYSLYCWHAHIDEKWFCCSSK